MAPHQYPNDDFPGWTFWGDEVSMGIYQVGGKHIDGRTVSHMGMDPDQLLKQCKADALAMPEKRHA
ncbi:MAG: hypothetical protein V4527_04830 [Pseudomonadota bacterium]